MLLNQKIFREYDIRGVVDVDFNTEFAEVLGVALASLVVEDFGESGSPSKRPVVGVGRDCRMSGEVLTAALIKGLVKGGVEVLNCGMGPTPQLYYAVFSQGLAGGVQVTGSHNPADQNGFKMMVGHTTLSGEAIQRLRQIVAGLRDGHRPAQLGCDVSGVVRDFDARTAYLQELLARSKPHMGTRRLKVVVDAGNGVGGLIGPDLLRGLGCEVVELYCEPDGRFPNHHPDPTVLENIEQMRQRVLECKADLGIAWDGDADRIGVVTENAEVVFGDMLLLFYGQQLLKEVEKPTIIGDVKCSSVLFEELKRLGANAVMAKTGHSLIKAKLKELKAHLAGEMSGHMFFAHRYYGFDDAMHASARLVEILSSSERTLSEMLHSVPQMVSTPEIRVDCADEIKFVVVEKAKEAFSEFEVNTLDGARITFPDGWGLVRASNTQPALVMRFEAKSSEQLASYRALVEERIAGIGKTLSV